jgi:DNA-binding transcriptional MerR regulator
MKEQLSIGEFAKLRNITTETLRYYDRIGLLKPVKIDSKTGYRYYSILQYEKIGTIKELRQLGMSIDEIKNYFNNRNLEQSYSILKDKSDELGNKIKELQQLEKNISEKLKHLDEISKITDFENIFIKEIEEREAITFNKEFKNEIELGYACLEIENALIETAPLLASNRIGILLKQEDIELNKYAESFVLFLFIKDRENIDVNHIKKFPKSIYACMHYKGNTWKTEEYLKNMIKFIEKKGYRVSGDVLEIIQVDISVTDVMEEELLEIQIPIKIC